MTAVLCFLLLFFCLGTSLAHPGTSASLAAPKPRTYDAQPRAIADTRVICFPPPDGHHVNTVVGTCYRLFAHFITNYEFDPDVAVPWTGDTAHWHDRGTVHLPKLESALNPDRTKECLMEVTDVTRHGDVYSASSVIRAGQQIVEECFRQDLCGEIALMPSATTNLAMCGTIHANGTGSNILPIRPGSRIRPGGNATQ